MKPLHIPGAVPARRLVLLVSLLAASLSLAAQQPAGDPGLSAPSPTAAPLISGAPGGSTGLFGEWEASLAIHELFGTLKEVQGGPFLVRVRFNKEGTGSLNRGGTGADETFEFDLKDNQLTVAWGSRLSPRVDLYRVLFLADGSLYLRSTRLSNVTGTIVYILKRKA